MARSKKSFQRFAVAALLQGLRHALFQLQPLMQALVQPPLGESLQMQLTCRPSTQLMRRFTRTVWRLLVSLLLGRRCSGLQFVADNSPSHGLSGL